MQKEKVNMKLVKIEMELGIDDEHLGNNHKDIAFYLNKMLYNDPEFFGEFGKENIISVEEFE